ncbi:galactose mutarotase [Vibrio sp. 10N.286.49.C2]|uniref:aldose epimerase family protein n=1 Tax=unclassified Vibrio TaxID=2614977 RepID=UPI000C8638BC|nr:MULTISPECIES: aldose epimerase family protein [unclassified Vibrio]PMH38173.1 galactose mutarotase [Vibrio sp. 10N.286.49.C2]PMH53621.1 galactose mutarotase [Vibrio sp. 10N.286.49.B1]
MKITVENWGQVEGQALPVKLFTLENRHGLKVQVTNYGCIVTSIEAPDREGAKANVVLGYDNLEQYLKGHPFFGAVAGRYANRIKDGRYELDGESFQLETNELPTRQHLHGGTKGFDKYVWDFSIEEQPEAIYLHLSRVSVDGESGYGGTMDVTHSVGLDEGNQLHYNFKAMTDKPTVVNLVNHSYYNLGGLDSGAVDEHELVLHANLYTPTTEEMIPTGEIKSVKDTGLDFTTATQIGSGEYDHNFVLNGRKREGEYHYAAELYDAHSGRMMTVLSTQPAVQFYNGFKLSNKPWLGRHGRHYKAREGLCLETQHFPDSPNQPHFPSVRLNPGEVFEEKTIHRFSVK